MAETDIAGPDLTFPRRGTTRPQLVQNARESLLAKAAKCNDPNNLEWSWDDRDKYERHTMSAVLDLVAAEEKLSTLASELVTVVEAIRIPTGSTNIDYNLGYEQGKAVARARLRQRCKELGVEVKE